jgi:antitoxin MazE
MKTKIVRIGNSRGIRIPKPLLEAAGLEGDVELKVVESGIMIAGVTKARDGWARAAAKAQERNEAGLLDEPSSSDFDESGWVW